MVAVKPRERILATATELFSQKGVLAVGVNSVISEADVAPMTLYRQFGGKDELVAATLERWSDRWLRGIHDKLAEYGDDGQARFEGLWDALEDWFNTQDFRGSFISNAAAELRSEPAHPAHKVIAAHRQLVREMLADLSLQAGAIDPILLADQLQVLMDGATAMATVDGQQGGAVSNGRVMAVAALKANSR